MFPAECTWLITGLHPSLLAGTAGEGEAEGLVLPIQGQRWGKWGESGEGGTLRVALWKHIIISV